MDAARDLVDHELSQPLTCSPLLMQDLTLPASDVDPGPDDDPRGPHVYSPGDLIADKYRLIRKAGEGGMGSIWVAMNTVLQLQVAVKLIKTDVRSPRSSERLLREARAAASLQHPAVVRVFDFGLTHWNEPFIVMELLEGESLRELLERDGSVPVERAVQMFLPIVEGLGAAHTRGIIHRDLKPDNIFLARDDSGRIQPKIVDFGIAKIRSLSGGSLGARLGSVVGSPQYMSPEQARGLEVDDRSDVFALCVALYETLSGSRPFAGSTVAELLMAVVNDEPMALSEVMDVDGELEAILARGLRKDPLERYGSMRDLGEALASWAWSRGVAEDACGGSLRATWFGGASSCLSSSSAPTLVRGTRSSLPPLEGPVFISPQPSSAMSSQQLALTPSPLVVHVQTPKRREPAKATTRPGSRRLDLFSWLALFLVSAAALSMGELQTPALGSSLAQSERTGEGGAQRERAVDEVTATALPRDEGLAIVLEPAASTIERDAAPSLEMDVAIPTLALPSMLASEVPVFIERVAPTAPVPAHSAVPKPSAEATSQRKSPAGAGRARPIKLTKASPSKGPRPAPTSQGGGIKLWRPGSARPH